MYISRNGYTLIDSQTTHVAMLLFKLLADYFKQRSLTALRPVHDHIDAPFPRVRADYRAAAIALKYDTGTPAQFRSCLT